MAGVVLLVAFVAIERRAAEPILPLRLLTHPTRAAANGARGLVYAGMYGNFFFLSQFLQEVDHYTPIKAGLAFLPAPVLVFLSSQATSRLIPGRAEPKKAMIAGAALAVASLLVASRLHAGNSYLQVFAGLGLIGIGAGMSLVSLTTAALADVETADAGAASGLVNVTQQLGAAVGLAVLVTVFETAGGASTAATLHGMDTAFEAAAGFAALALALVAVVIGRGRPTVAPLPVDLAVVEAA